ncbi:hypothetical protein AMTRI_Chr06g174140 [Amborella trichopoda]|uniref:MACPF domain-containing protein n=1 Tax=Amborella trichopoda TaxID=13333 RepID=W1PGL7_AMBTC|nr:MACPF domain-containing protein At1g14780 [Amborella trichopoda]ERN06771.1 hypothetical protein AMTR_s00005p00141350 [Amborella trichopoda]|eukprot:XP_006845096.1 MACPF domain-containing protein At1g14780 [Amborella trichopoda]
MEGVEGVGVRAVESLGRGFDLTCDFRLKFAKGLERLVELDDQNLRDISIPGGPTIRNVSSDIKCDKGDRLRFRSDVLEFNQMSELLNQKSSIPGKIPSGYFNAIFDFSGIWLEDAKDTKHLAFDGYFISLYNLHLTVSALVLREEVKKAVPPNWEPATLSSFIQTYGTHIIVGMAVGGQDLVCVRQSSSSSIPPAELKGHLESLGDYIFSDCKNLSPIHRKSRESKYKVPEVFSNILQSNSVHSGGLTAPLSKDGLTIICSKQGGNTSLGSHYKWLQTVPANPEAVFFKFVPIMSLLNGIPGSGYLSHAINLYLRYKPALEDLQYFLEFQVPQQWAPIYELPLGHQRMKLSYPSLRFSFMGPKLYVNTTQVSSGRKPVVGFRLFLEGKKFNRLAIHVQHLSSLPHVLQSMRGGSDSSPSSFWRSSNNETHANFLEPLQWHRYSHVCTAPIKYDPAWLHNCNGVFIVTGAQLLVQGKGKRALHLSLHFTCLPNCQILKSVWGCAPVASNKSTSFLYTLSTTFTSAASTPKQGPTPVLNSGVYPDGPPMAAQAQKMLRFVDTREVARGPQDVPGHWLVTAAKLVIEGGKMGLHVKFSLLNYGLA